MHLRFLLGRFRRALLEVLAFGRGFRLQLGGRARHLVDCLRRRGGLGRIRVREIESLGGDRFGGLDRHRLSRLDRREAGPPGFRCLGLAAARIVNSLRGRSFGLLQFGRPAQESDAHGHARVRLRGVDRAQDVGQAGGRALSGNLGSWRLCRWALRGLHARCPNGRALSGNLGSGWPSGQAGEAIVEGVDGRDRCRHLGCRELVERLRPGRRLRPEAPADRHGVMMARADGLAGRGGGGGRCRGKPAGLASVVQRLRRQWLDLIRPGLAARF